MATKEIVSGAKLRAHNSCRTHHMASQLLRQGVMEAEKNEAIRPICNIYNASETIDALSKRHGAKEISNSSFDFFRAAITRDIKKTISGADMSVDYTKALRDAESIIREHKHTEAYQRLQSAYGKTDFNDEKSVEALSRKLKKLEKSGIATQPDVHSAINGHQEFADGLLAVYHTLDSKKLKTNVKELEKILLEGRDSKSCNDILGRIITGDINVDEVITNGEFGGKALSETDKTALQALKTYATNANIIASSENDLLKAIGHSSKTLRFDLNNFRQVDARIREFGGALDVTYKLPGNNSWGNITARKLEKIISKANLSPAQAEAAKELLKLRKHSDMLREAHLSRRRIAMMSLRVARKIDPESAMLDAINKGVQVRSIIHSANTIGRLSGKIIARAGRAAMAMARSLGKVSYGIANKTALLLFKTRIPHFSDVLNSVKSFSKTIVSQIKSTGIGQVITPKVEDVAKKATDATNKLRTVKAAKTAQKASKSVGKKAKKQAFKQNLKNKFYNKLSPKQQQLLQKRKSKKAAENARRAAKKAEKNFAKSAGKSVTQLLKKIIIVAIPIIIIILLIIMLAVVLSTLLSMTLSINNDVLSEDAQKSILHGVVNDIARAEKGSRVQDRFIAAVDENYNYYSGIDPNKASVNLLSDWEDENAVKSGCAIYTYTTDDGSRVTIPTNPYSTAKLCVAAANTFVNFSRNCTSTNDARKAFVEYAFLTYYNLNKFDVEGALTMTEATTHDYSYYCSDNNEYLYQHQDIIVNKSIGDFDPIKLRKSNKENLAADGSDRIYLIDSKLATPSAGCYSRKYSGFTIIETERATNKQSAHTATSVNGIYTHDDIVYSRLSVLITNKKLKKAYNDGTLIKGNALCEHFDGIDYSITYMLDPYISSDCSDNDACLTDLGSENNFALRKQIFVCDMNDDKWEHSCDNKGIIKCDGSCSQNGQCMGHTACLGHYNCDQANGHYFCPGHTCQYCTGELTLRLVHIIDDNGAMYPLAPKGLDAASDKLIALDDVIALKSDMLYTIDLVSIFEDEDTATIKLSYSTLAKKWGFDGWDEFAMSCVEYLVESDWYEDYGIPAWEFPGAVISSGERQTLLENLKIPNDYSGPKREAVINAAIDAVGRVPYYPLGVCRSNEYEKNYFGSYGSSVPPVNEGAFVYQAYGLSKTAFLDYIIWQAMGRNNSLIIDKQYTKTKQYTYQKAFSNDLQPGDLVFHRNDDGEIDDAGVFWGFISSVDDGIRKDPNAWKTAGFTIIHMGEQWAEVMTYLPGTYTDGSWWTIGQIY